MKFDPESFFQSARSIRLHKGEFDEIRQNVQKSVTKEGAARLDSTMDQGHFLASAQKVSLGAGEKAHIRAAIMESIRGSSPSYSPFYRFLRICSGSMAAVMIFVLCGAGVSYAAESALPGDALYTVKVNFTEAVRLRLANSVEAKARVQARLVGRRLEEAEKLAEKSRLTAERVAIVQERLTAHVAALEVDLQELAAFDQETSGSIAIDMAAEMEAHENLLQRIRTDNDPDDVEKLLKQTRKARNIAEKITVSADIRNLAEVKAKKADDEIRKTKAAKTWKTRVDEDANIANTILTAEDDLKASEEAAASAEIRVEKATSALNKAKEAKFMLLLPARTKLKEKRERPQRDDIESSASSLSSVSSSSSSPTSSSVSSASSRSRSSSSSSSEKGNKSSESESSVRSSSISSSIPVSSTISETLKETDDLIKKTLP